VLAQLTVSSNVRLDKQPVQDDTRQLGKLSEPEIREKIAARDNWHQRFEIVPGIYTPGRSDVEGLLQKLQLPDDLSGLSVLDVGACDGFFSFTTERRGASVVAVDYKSQEYSGFAIAAEILGSQVRHVHANVYDLETLSLGQFDVVLFLGVIYHLQDPMRALHVLRRHCRGVLYLESFCIDHAFRLPGGEVKPLDEIDPMLGQCPIAQFYPGYTLHGVATNYWGFNAACLQAMLSEAMFRPIRSKVDGDRVVIAAEAVADKDKEYFNAIAAGRLFPGMRE
jgi:SAM-dependent methyltransferase